MQESRYSGFSGPPRKRCCRRGTLLLVLGLVTAAMWAGLLSLLLVWHWDTLENLKQLEKAAARNVSQVAKDLQRHQSDQMAQKSQALQMVEEVKAEQKRVKSQDSKFSQYLDRLREDLNTLKSQGLNERRMASDELKRLQEEVAKLRIELQVSNARTSGVIPRETLALALPMVPSTVPTTMPATVPSTAPATMPTKVPSTPPATMPKKVPSTAPTTMPTKVPSMAPATIPATMPATVPTTAAPMGLSSTPGSMCNLCPKDWVNFKHKCYYFGKGAKKWIQARYACEDLGGRLVSIHSREEQDFLTTRANKKGSWIGLRDVFVEGEFLWMDGSPVGYSNWYPGEPNNHDRGEDCVLMKESGEWNDAFCRDYLDTWVCDRLASCEPPTTLQDGF
ncbi:low affinity immunoglobulin epsilon Fc receptor isoform X2 [Tupaia chinensis]|uniref:low affinity immunoglobulin epsilon Fc receptor isoform X2 n=1 Tax=Tupaia chinensis TaxID=246437 RepID=UPI000FFB2C43|nr:low affinity immunoglobulin epsilon Fc receptor isoform X2 [Tupaia chinensis]